MRIGVVVVVVVTALAGATCVGIVVVVVAMATVGHTRQHCAGAGGGNGRVTGSRPKRSEAWCTEAGFEMMPTCTAIATVVAG
jgi:hypothetical protein